MNAIIVPFHVLQAGAEAFSRALQFGYRPNTANALRKVARREASVWEDPADTAVRVVRPPHGSATTPTTGGAA